ncbi:MAG TPA: hypothetical protein V6D08_08110 [Candidatus Obscuribacterales bacterium]
MRTFGLEGTYSRFEAVGFNQSGQDASVARLALLQDAGLERPERQLERQTATWIENEAVRAGRAELLELAAAALKKEKDIDRLRADMETFERRAANDGLSPQEVAETYRQAGRLLKAPDSAPVPVAERARIAQQIIHQAAQPVSIDQGDHNTCNTAALEVRIYTRFPSKAARLVADIATANRFITKDGTAVTLHPESLKPDEESKHHPVSDGKRSLASQIFQITAANVHWFRAERDFYDNPVPRGTIGFAQFPKMRGNRFNTNGQYFDTGERLIDVNVSPPVARMSDPGIRVRYLFGINEQITGVGETGFIVENAMLAARDTVHVSSPEELKEAIVAIKSAGGLPAILRVHAANPPFNKAGGNWHMVNVTDIDPASDKVRISNQWGKSSDLTVKVKDLYQATLPHNPAPGWSDPRQRQVLDPDLERSERFKD